MIREFVPIARAVIGVKNLKIITFGPRPQDFFACNAPIKGLYELGVRWRRIPSWTFWSPTRPTPATTDRGRPRDMAQELGVTGNNYPELLPRMAQFELTLLDWAENHRGSPEVCGLCR